MDVWQQDTVYGEELLAPRPTPKLEDHPLLVVRDCLFNIFVATLYTGDRSSIRDLRTRHAVVTETHLSRTSTDTIHEIQCVTSVMLLHVSIHGCHPQKVTEQRNIPNVYIPLFCNPVRMAAMCRNMWELNT